MIATQILAAIGASAVETVGAYAGLAAVLGLGVLSLLYFAQAREVKRLREWAGRQPERAVEIDQRVQADAQRRVVAQPLAPATFAAQNDAARHAAAAAELYAKLPPAPPPPAPLVGPPGQLARPTVPAPASSPPGVVVPVPGGVPTAAPAAGVPALGLGSVPAVAKPGQPGPGPGSAMPGQPAPGSAMPGQPAPGSAMPGQPAPGSAKPGQPAPGSVTPAPGTVTPAAKPAALAPSATATPTPKPSPVPAPAAATPAAAARQAIVASRTVAPPPSPGSNGGQDTHESAAARPSSLPPLPPARAPEPTSYDDDDGRSGFSGARIGALIAGAVVIVLVAAVFMLSAGDEPATKPNDFGTSTTAAATPGDPAADTSADTSGDSSSTGSATKVDRRSVKVAVLNGTTQTGLARNVADKLEQAGFTIPTVGNNADQQVPQTIVSFSAGNERAAQTVAGLIKVDRSSVQAIDTNTSVAAEADVVVTVGTDLIG